MEPMSTMQRLLRMSVQPQKVLHLIPFSIFPVWWLWTQRKKGVTLKITLDNAYMEKCEENFLWLDYKNICKVMEAGSKIYVDEGFISLRSKRKVLTTWCQRWRMVAPWAARRV